MTLVNIGSGNGMLPGELTSLWRIAGNKADKKLRSHMRWAVAEQIRADFYIPAPLPRVCSHIRRADAGESAISWRHWWFGAHGFEADAENWVLDPFLVERILLPPPPAHVLERSFRKCSWYQLIKWVWKTHLWNYLEISDGQWVKSIFRMFNVAIIRWHLTIPCYQNIIINFGYIKRPT